MPMEPVPLVPEEFTKDLRHSADRLPPKLRSLVTAAERANVGVNALNAVLETCPESVVYDPTQPQPAAAEARDVLLVAELLSLWKVTHLVMSARRGWSPGPHGFDAFATCTAARAALEEAAEADRRTRELPSGTQLDPVSLRQMGVAWQREQAQAPSGVKQRVGELCAGTPFSIESETGRELYSFLSAVAHAEGQGRALFGGSQDRRGVHALTFRPSRYKTATAQVASAAALAVIGWATWTSRARLAPILDQLNDSAGQTDGSSQLHVLPPLNPAQPPVRRVRDGWWTRMEPE